MIEKARISRKMGHNIATCLVILALISCAGGTNLSITVPPLLVLPSHQQLDLAVIRIAKPSQTLEPAVESKVINYLDVLALPFVPMKRRSHVTPTSESSLHGPFLCVRQGSIQAQKRMHIQVYGVQYV